MGREPFVASRYVENAVELFVLVQKTHGRFIGRGTGISALDDLDEVHVGEALS